MPFFRKLQEEIVKAQSNQKAVYIQMYYNSKLGPKIIPGDPHAPSETGKIITGKNQRNALVVINNFKEKCRGEITRQRTTRKKGRKHYGLCSRL